MIRSDVRSAFNRDAGIYDAGRRRLVPCFDDFYAAAVAFLPEPAGRPLKVLDLGGGTGLLASRVLAARPGADLSLIDVAPAMLEIARRRFDALGAPVNIRAGDYGTEPLGHGYDAVVSALSIHHLEGLAKRRLYARIFEALRPGGVLINADSVLGATPALQARYHAHWLAAVRACGASERELDQALDRMTHDRLALLDAQLAWLTAAGFSDVDCFYRWYGFAVFGGWKP